MDTDLRRRVLVTGGSGAIGGAIADAFAEASDQVVVTSRSGRSDGAHPGVAMALDDAASVTAAVASAIERLGGLDTFVHSAVRWPAGGANRFEDLAPSEWRAVLRANVEGTFAALQAALPALRASGHGRIVLLSSGIAEEGHPPTPAYGAAKAALHGMSRTLAWDAGRDGVLVNVVAVGFTRTPRGLERFGPGVYERAGDLIPQRRVSSPEDVAGLVRFLGSSANASVTGEVVREGTSTARASLPALS